MKIDEYISSLRHKNVIVSVQDGNLAVKGADGAVTPEIIEELRSKKLEILEFFNAVKKNRGTELIPQANTQDHYPLSRGQMRLWILDQLGEGKGVYNVPLDFVIENLDVSAFEKALELIVERHEILRTVIHVIDGQPRQVIKDISTFDMKVNYFNAASEELFNDIIVRECRFPFDLSESSMRVSAIDRGDGTSVLCFVFHHIIIDEWSSGVLIREFKELYEGIITGKGNHLSPLKIQYKDYAVWQNDLIDSGSLEPSKKFWTDKLSGELTRLILPLDFDRPDERDYQGSRVEYEISREITDQLVKFGHQYKASLFIVLLSALKALLHRYTGQEDIILGYPVSGRDHYSLENQVGFYSNTVVFRTPIKGDLSFREILELVNTNSLETFEHQSYPFDLLVNDIDDGSNNKQNPLFDVLISYHDSASEGGIIEESEMDSNTIIYRENTGSKFDLSYDFNRISRGSITGAINFNNNLFKKEKILRMVGHFKNFLMEVLKKPDNPISTLFFLENEETDQILRLFNNTNKGFGFECGIKHLFEARAQEFPESISVLTEAGEITFGQMNERANRLAHYLHISFEVSGQDHVGVLMDNTVDRLLTLLAITKLGAAYVPLDMDFPAERISFILKDTNAKLLITDGIDIIQKASIEYQGPVFETDQLDMKIEGCTNSNPQAEVGLESIFAILYTSGSTGKPKGVLIKNEGLINRINWFWNHYKCSREDVIYQKTPFVFDVSIGEIFMPLCFGAKLVLAEKETSLQITENIIRFGVTYVHFSPTQLNNYLDAIEGEPLENSDLRMIACSGEELTKNIVNKYYSRYSIPLSNLYGPTEASIEVTYYDTTLEDARSKESKIPIGKPIDNVQIYVLDRYHQLSPIGFHGEIGIGGVCLAKGYFNDPEKTKKQFIECSFDQLEKTRVYKTGDVGKWSDDGLVYFLGRVDNQISINGSRIEPGEIESAISDHPAIHEVAVVTRQDEFMNWHLIAYYTLKKGKSDLAEVEKPEIVEPEVRIGELENSRSLSDISTAQNVYELLHGALLKHQDRIALVCGDASMTYKELYEEVEKFASYLIEQYGVSLGDPVVLLAGRSERTIISILALLKIGAVYVPVDREYPLARMEQIVRDSAATLIIADRDIEFNALSALAPIAFSEEPQNTPNISGAKGGESGATQRDLCYICYTSGSTGKPKGVMIEQQSVVDYIETFSRYFNISDADTVVQQSSISFDTFVEEVFPTLYTGAKLVILPDGGRNVEAMIDAVNLHKVSVLSTTPLVINELNAQYDRLDHMPRVIISGGDTLRKSYVDRLLAHTSVFNTYGPTEFTVCATFGRIKHGEDCNIIGKPVSNYQVFLLNDNLKKVRFGEIGEMHIAGAGMARGYLNNEAETYKYFIPNPFGEGRLYKTGDLARWNKKGELEFLGRKDSQVKLKGYRVEPIEVDMALQTCEEITNCITLAKEDYRGEKHLVSYYTTSQKISGEEIREHLNVILPYYMVPDYFVEISEFVTTHNGKIDTKTLPVPELLLQDPAFNAELKDFLRKKLPAYMIPAHLMVLSELPMTVSGKIDRKSLENRELKKLRPNTINKPVNKTEETLLEIWKDVLKIPEVSTDTNFFELGGNSIKATQIMSVLYKRFEKKIALKDIYNNPTIAELARCLKTDGKTESLMIKLGNVVPDRPSVFFIPPILGSATVFRELASSLDDQVNVLGFQYRGFDHDEPFDLSIDAMATSFTREITMANQAGQPMFLIGYSMGGTVGFEMARILEQQGYPVTLIIIDRNVNEDEEAQEDEEISRLLSHELAYWHKDLKDQDFDRVKRLVLHNVKILAAHKIQGKIQASIIAIEAKRDTDQIYMEEWNSFTNGSFEHHYVQGDHYTIIDNLETLAPIIKRALLQPIS
ncbi:amino acid adenylation domain-containing protein [Fulvivirga sp. 29W222]|uniref:Amino acid adenylation domain-containing protein n=1 Tax=Fulvivirga marina TaxID=2494733 RepID=A0A937FUX0_9BACT|nr:non-ribosomal peptide synthetase [Fulvivirga marina]MBL6446394.1 amino acid adenylation domain-containing protein [Fulvivirga marina]